MVLYDDHLIVVGSDLNVNSILGVYRIPINQNLSSVSAIKQENDVKNTARYNLQGQRLNTVPQKGIYIQNGKKVVVK